MSSTNERPDSDPVFEAKKILLAAVAQRDARIKQLESIIRSLGACVPVDTIAKFLQADGESQALQDYLDAIVDLYSKQQKAHNGSFKFKNSL